MLGRGKNFSFDFSKAITLCKNSFLEGLCRVVVDLGNILYHHTPFYIGARDGLRAL